MRFTVAYTDAGGASRDRSYRISLATWLKHFVLAGAGFTPGPKLLLRGLGALAWYWDFVAPVATGSDCFGEPIPILRDPTLKAHFSNLAGRAFADFLGREIEGALITRSYEGVLAATGTRLTGSRPDLLAIRPGRVVAIEAKGYAKKYVSATEMATHKSQAAQGSLSRHSFAASVAYALYDEIKVSYLDPEDDFPRPDRASVRSQLQEYFALAEVSASELGHREVILQNRRVVHIPLPEAVRGRVPIDVERGATLNNIALLIDRELVSEAARALASERSEADSRFLQPAHRVDVEGLFIDSDGIGISTAG